MTPLFFKEIMADRIETPERSAREALAHVGHSVLGGWMPRSRRICFRFSVMRTQKSVNSSQGIVLDHDVFKSANISGNQTRCASPAGISPSALGHACSAMSRPSRWSPMFWA